MLPIYDDLRKIYTTSVANYFTKQKTIYSSMFAGFILLLILSTGIAFGLVFGRLRIFMWKIVTVLKLLPIDKLNTKTLSHLKKFLN